MRELNLSPDEYLIKNSIKRKPKSEGLGVFF